MNGYVSGKQELVALLKRFLWDTQDDGGEWDDFTTQSLSDPYEEFVCNLALFLDWFYPAKKLGWANREGMRIMERLVRLVEADKLPFPPTEEELNEIGAGLIPERYRILFGSGEGKTAGAQQAPVVPCHPAYQYGRAELVALLRGVVRRAPGSFYSWADFMEFFTLTDRYDALVHLLARTISWLYTPPESEREACCGEEGAWALWRLAQAIEDDCLPFPPTAEETISLAEGRLPERYASILQGRNTLGEQKPGEESRVWKRTFWQNFLLRRFPRLAKRLLHPERVYGRRALAALLRRFVRDREGYAGDWTDMTSFYRFCDPYEEWVRQLAMAVIRRFPARHAFKHGCNDQGACALVRLAEAVETGALPYPPTREEQEAMMADQLPERYLALLTGVSPNGGNT